MLTIGELDVQTAYAMDQVIQTGLPENAFDRGEWSLVLGDPLEILLMNEDDEQSL